MTGERTSRRRRHPARLAAALVVSLLVHGLLVLAIVLAWPRFAVTPRTTVTELRLVRPAPRAPARPALHPAVTPPHPLAVAPHHPTPVHHRAPAPHPPAVATHPAAPPPPAAAIARAPSPATTPSATPAAPATTAPAPGAGPVDLLPPDALVRATVGDDAGAPPDARKVITRRIRTYIAELKARDRVEVGLVDPYFTHLGDTMEKGFKPTWDQLDPARSHGLGNAVVAWLKDYATTMDRYGRTGSPYRTGERFTGGIGPPDLPLAGNIGASDSRVALHQQGMIMDYLRDAVHGKAGGAQLLTLVRVTQGSDGHLLDVRVARSSGASGYDRFVLRAVRKSLAHAPVPKRRGSGLGLKGDRIVSLWAFRTRFVVVPPVPGIGCDIGTNLDSARCYRPLERVVWPHLKLVAVY